MHHLSFFGPGDVTEEMPKGGLGSEVVGALIAERVHSFISKKDIQCHISGRFLLRGSFFLNGQKEDQQRLIRFFSCAKSAASASLAFALSIFSSVRRRLDIVCCSPLFAAF